MRRAWHGDGLDARGQAPLGLRLLVVGHAHSSLRTEARLSRAVLLNEADVVLSHDDVTDEHQVTRYSPCTQIQFSGGGLRERVAAFKNTKTLGFPR